MKSMQICVLSQTLQESGPGLVKPSQQLKLTCIVSGFELTSYGIHWIRQAPGKGLEWIGVIWGDGSADYTDSLKSRTTITKDNAKKQVYLQMKTQKRIMSNMEAADTGEYYCARDTHEIIVEQTREGFTLQDTHKYKFFNQSARLAVFTRPADLAARRSISTEASARNATASFIRGIFGRIDSFEVLPLICSSSCSIHTSSDLAVQVAEMAGLNAPVLASHDFLSKASAFWSNGSVRIPESSTGKTDCLEVEATAASTFGTRDIVF
ncbi:unnamed protein product [Ranitomeya imitator]|uniref:Ig-like domain-containing protein n=1 Tax=Ranitomeya imitator TaxID=111125 RepID=A0ABN9KXF3_9NEOB|nr:unnamed protein product [Ranitomeya imitator]